MKVDIIRTSQENFDKYDSYINRFEKARYSKSNLVDKHLLFETYPVMVGKGIRYSKFEEFIRKNCN